ncbi:M48 family metalloprotease [Umezawaea sp. NPDC059074]|uniref:M48 family metalloprotease n=1 Tax=Umezawaea sp. NPDC059074 TaxID=3346716 RepID=UPI0036CAAC5B
MSADPTVVARPTRPASRPARLWWVYLLVGVALAITGAGAAQALYVTRDLGDYATTEACLAASGISLDEDAAVNVRDAPQFALCTRDYNRGLGVTTLLGAMALPAATWLLMLVSGLGVRRRLRRGGAASAPVPLWLTERFEDLCASQGLTGTRRPGLVVAGPAAGVREAFTTGVPFTRPQVVLPSSYASREPDEFDVVVLHELAHVRARDLLWASAVWWAGWLTVPALLLAVIFSVSPAPVLWRTYGGSLLTAIVAAVTMLALRSALLRRREFAADLYAVDALDAARVSAVLARTASWTSGDGTGAVGPWHRWWSRSVRGVRTVFATHPPLTQRSGVGTRAAHREGGFAFTTAVGIIAMLTYQTVYGVVSDLFGYVVDDPGVPSNLSLAVGFLIWSSVIVPTWTRRARVAGIGWVGPWAGTVCGLIIGYLLRAPGASHAFAIVFTGHWPLLVACLVVVTTGIGVLTAALATRLAHPGTTAGVLDDAPRPVRTAAAVLAVTVALVTTWSTTLMAVMAYLASGEVAVARWQVAALGGQDAWWYAAPLVLLGLLVVTAAPRHHATGPTAEARRPRRGWTTAAVIGVSGTVGGVAAALSFVLRVRADADADTTLGLLYGMWWISALTGGVVVFSVLLAHRASGVLRAVPAAFAAGMASTVVAGLAQFASQYLAHYGRNGTNFLDALRKPLALLLFSAVVTVPVLLVIVAVTRTVRRPGTTRPTTLMWTLSTGGGVGVLALAAVCGLLGPVTITADDPRHGRSWSAKLDEHAGRTAPVARPSPRSDPGRALDARGAEAVLTGAAASLPGAPDPDPDEETSGTTATPLEPATCNDALTRNNVADKALDRTAELTRTYHFPQAGTAGGVRLTTAVTSYTTPLKDLAGEVEVSLRCDRYTIRDEQFDVGHRDGTMRTLQGSTAGYPAQRFMITTTGRVNAKHVAQIVVTSSVLVGHNYISATVAYWYVNNAPDAATITFLERIMGSALDTMIDNLGR